MAYIGKQLPVQNSYKLLDGWEQALAQFVLGSDIDLTFGDQDGAKMVDQMIEVGLVRVVRSLTRVLCLRWVGGLSAEEGIAAWRVLRELRASKRSPWVHGILLAGERVFHDMLFPSGISSLGQVFP